QLEVPANAEVAECQVNPRLPDPFIRTSPGPTTCDIRLDTVFAPSKGAVRILYRSPYVNWSYRFSHIGERGSLCMDSPASPDSVGAVRIRASAEGRLLNVPKRPYSSDFAP